MRFRGGDPTTSRNSRPVDVALTQSLPWAWSVRPHKRPGRGNRSKWALMTRFNDGGGELPVSLWWRLEGAQRKNALAQWGGGKVSRGSYAAQPGSGPLTEVEISGELQREVGAVHAERFVMLLTTESQRYWSIARWLARGALLSAHPCVWSVGPRRQRGETRARRSDVRLTEWSRVSAPISSLGRGVGACVVTVGRIRGRGPVRLDLLFFFFFLFLPLILFYLFPRSTWIRI
jgi:hypothetical protein